MWVLCNKQQWPTSEPYVHRRKVFLYKVTSPPTGLRCNIQCFHGSMRTECFCFCTETRGCEARLVSRFSWFAIITSSIWFNLISRCIMMHWQFTASSIFSFTSCIDDFVIKNKPEALILPAQRKHTSCIKHQISNIYSIVLCWPVSCLQCEGQILSSTVTSVSVPDCPSKLTSSKMCPKNINKNYVKHHSLLSNIPSIPNKKRLTMGYDSEY